MVTRDSRGAWTATLTLLLGPLGACSDGEEAPTDPSSSTSTSTSGGGGPSGCPPGTTPVDDDCREAGIQPNGCPAGEPQLADGTCGPPGIPPEECAEGFVPDGQQGCEALLPAEPCAAGMMALPGETTCRAVATCGSGTWGDIPVEPDTEYVDAAYQGGASDGSPTAPWTTIADAIAAASPGAIVALEEGAYAGDVVIQDKAVRLWGRCPELVAVEGTLAPYGAILIGPNADGTEIRSLAVTGAYAGVILSGSQDVILDRLWVHDLGYEGVHADVFDGPTSLSLTDSLIEGTHNAGVSASGVDLSVERTVLRHTEPYDLETGSVGLGLVADESGSELPSATLRASLVEAIQGSGVAVIGAHLAIEGSVVRDTIPGPNIDGGVGIEVFPLAGSGIRPQLDVKTSLVSGNRIAGIGVYDGVAHIDTTVVRDTQVDGEGRLGTGISAAATDLSSEPTVLTVTRSLVAGNQHFGIGVDGAELTVEASVIRDVAQSHPLSAAAGVVGSDYLSGRPGVLAVSQSLLEHNGGTGVFAMGVTAVVEGTVIRDTYPENDLYGTLGIGVEAHGGAISPTTVEVRHSLIQRATQAGALAIDADLVIDGTRIEDTQPSPVEGVRGHGVHGQLGTSGQAGSLQVHHSRIERSGGFGLCLVGVQGEVDRSWIGLVEPDAESLYGDGIVVSADAVTAELTVTQSFVGMASRVGISNLGSALAIGASRLECNPIHLAGDDYLGHSFSFQNLGGNSCSCEGAAVTCKTSSAELHPPAPLDKESPEL